MILCSKGIVTAIVVNHPQPLINEFSYLIYNERKPRDVIYLEEWRTASQIDMHKNDLITDSQ